jgi:hypothetical protein
MYTKNLDFEKTNIIMYAYQSSVILFDYFFFKGGGNWQELKWFYVHVFEFSHIGKKMYNAKK